jgi:hypothetical protein
MNFLGPPMKLCRIKRKIKGGRETFLDRIKRLDVSRQARGPRRLRDRVPLLLDETAPRSILSCICPKAIVFHHLDRFRPGNFHRKRATKLELKHWGHYHPAIRFVIPKRNIWFAV